MTADLVRQQAGATMLGAVVGHTGIVPVDLDVLVVDREPVAVGVPTLVRTGDAATAVAAVRSGAIGILVDPYSDEVLDAVRAVSPHAVLASLEPAPEREGVVAAQLVDSVDAARRAMSAGTRLVLYDLPAMVGALVATLPSARESRRTSGRAPLVLLSGMLGDEHLWDDVSAALADIAVPWPLRIDLDDSVAAMAESVLAAAPPRFALAGHSLGAIVGLEIVRRASHRVTHLALLNASARAADAAQLAVWARWGEQLRDGAFDRLARELAASTLGPARRDEPALAQRNAAMAATVTQSGFARQLAAQATRPDSREHLAAITVPTLVVSGTADDVCPPVRQEELVELCPAATLVSVDGGHMLPLEAPADVADALRAWLAAQ